MKSDQIFLTRLRKLKDLWSENEMFIFVPSPDRKFLGSSVSHVFLIGGGVDFGCFFKILFLQLIIFCAQFNLFNWLQCQHESLSIGNTFLESDKFPKISQALEFRPLFPRPKYYQSISKKCFFGRSSLPALKIHPHFILSVRDDAQLIGGRHSEIIWDFWLKEAGPFCNSTF